MQDNTALRNSPTYGDKITTFIMSWLENVGNISKCPRRENGFQWELPNYIAYESDEPGYQPPCVITSSYFRVFDVDWRLALIRNKEGHSRYIGLFLWKSPSYNLSSSFAIRLGLINNFGEFLPFLEGETDNAGCFGSWEFLNEFRLLSEKKIISPTGILRFSCEISKKRPSIDAIPQETLTECEKAENRDPEEIMKEENSEVKGVDRLIKNLEHLLLNEWGSDVILKNGDHEFRAHMTILGARSLVFASMFQHDMMEKKTGEVDISDCSTAGFKVFLQFLYSGKADISPENVIDLYYIADKYQVDDLKLDCIEFMKDKLTVDNFCDVIALSLRHSELDLQKSAIDFFCNNYKGIIKTVQWQKYLAENPTHANELFIKAVNA